MASYYFITEENKVRAMENWHKDQAELQAIDKSTIKPAPLDEKPICMTCGRRKVASKGEATVFPLN